MVTRAHVLISGRVQGVFFRAWIAEEAQNLDLTGWVRNTQEGNVEAVLEPSAGSGQEGRKRIEEMVRKCWEGPRMAKVEQVEVNWGKATGEFTGFEVKY